MNRVPPENKPGVLTSTQRLRMRVPKLEGLVYTQAPIYSDYVAGRLGIQDGLRLYHLQINNLRNSILWASRWHQVTTWPPDTRSVSARKIGPCLRNWF